MRRTTLRIAAVVVAASMMASAALADPVVRIVTLNLPPYGYVDQGESTGLTHEASELIAAEAGYESVNTHVPLARAVKELSENDADLVMLFPTGPVEAAGLNIGCVLPMETVVIGRSGSAFDSLQDLRGKRVAKIRGAKYDDAFDNEPGIEVYETDSYPQNFRMLFAGRVDAIIGPSMGLMYTAKQLGLTRESFGRPLTLGVKTACVYTSVQAGMGEMQQRLEAAVKRLVERHAFQRLIEKYSLR